MTGEKHTKWAGVFARHQLALTSFFRRRFGDRTAAQDLTQEVFVRLLQADRREIIRNPEAYLRTVAANLVREHAVLRKRELMTPRSAADEERWLHEAGLPEDDDDPEQRVELLAQVLEELPPRHRAVLIMQHRDDLSYQQIAGELGVSTHMVKKYVVKALAACRRALRPGE